MSEEYNIIMMSQYYCIIIIIIIDSAHVMQGRRCNVIDRPGNRRKLQVSKLQILCGNGLECAVTGTLVQIYLKSAVVRRDRPAACTLVRYV